MKNSKKTQDSALNVEQRIRAVLHAKRQEDPTVILSISEICRLAKVNRSGIYANHQSLLEEIRPRSERSCENSTRNRSSSVRLPVIEQPNNQALLYLCLELQLEIRALRALVPKVRDKSA